MSLDVLDVLETRIGEAAERLESMRQRNAELEARIVELEGRVAEAPTAAAGSADWDEERDRLKARIEQLVERLEALLRA